MCLWVSGVCVCLVIVVVETSVEQGSLMRGCGSGSVRVHGCFLLRVLLVQRSRDWRRRLLLGLAYFSVGLGKLEPYGLGQVRVEADSVQV